MKFVKISKIKRELKNRSFLTKTSFKFVFPFLDAVSEMDWNSPLSGGLSLNTYVLIFARAFFFDLAFFTFSF